MLRMQVVILKGLRGLELQLELVGDEGDELGVRRLALGVGDGIAEEFLQGFEVSSVPCQFDSMPDGTLNSRGGC